MTSALAVPALLALAALAAPAGADSAPKRTPEQLAEAAALWRLYGGNHWQRKRNPEIDARGPAPSQPGPGALAACKLPGMIPVEGGMLQGPVEGLQDSVCDRWVDNQSTWVGSSPPRCAVFNADRWHKKAASLPRKKLSFCIDKYEYPDVEGQNPVIMMTYPEAEAACREAGKRLCTDEEWTFACEGEEGLPYPYGFERSPSACNADHGWTQWDDKALFHDRTGPRAAAELERLWKGMPSGALPGCVSPFGVYDLTGNIDEWTVNRISHGSYKGAQKGGYWGPVRARCRPATIAHSEAQFFYQQGTRCCADR
jgi:hypothetical protein